MDSLSFYLTNLLTVGAMMFIGWLISLKTDNVTVADTLWGLGFVLIAWISWFRADGYPPRQWLLVALTTLWGLRLSFYMFRRNYGKPEDPRYAQWRQAGGKRFRLISLFKVFLLQALFLWVIALALQAGQAAGQPGRIGLGDMAGIMVWTIGFVFETVSDRQLARFKADPANRNKVLNTGLWRFSRHPNYFGESLIWWGIFLIALSNPANWWTVVSPLVITVVLTKMTGVALSEKLSVQNRPDYRAYVQTTPAFFPWIPNHSKQRGDAL